MKLRINPWLAVVVVALAFALLVLCGRFFVRADHEIEMIIGLLFAGIVTAGTVQLLFSNPERYRDDDPIARYF